MRIVAFILFIVITTGLLMGGVFLLVVHTDDKYAIWVFVALLALMIFVYGPLTLGSVRAFWDVTGSEDSRRYYRRVILVVIGLEVLAAVVTVVYAVVTRAGALIPIIFIGGGVLLTAVALLVGPALYRYDRTHRPPASDWVAIEPSQISRRILATVITFVGVFALGIIGLGIANTVFPRTLRVAQLLPFALSFAFIISGGVSVFSTTGWNRRLRDVTDRDPSRLRRVARVVLRNKNIDLDDRDLVAAARCAAVISVTMPFQLANIVLLYAGLLLQQIPALQNGSANEYSIIVIILLIAFLVVLLPLQIVRIRRARQYARTHAADAESPMATPTN